MRPVDPASPTDDVHGRETDDGRRGPPLPDERVPAVVGGRYAIRGVLGRGAMGVVYRAHDATLGRDVALKVLSDPSGERADRRARLAREAQLQATLRHPGVLAIHDVGEVVGAPFVVFELVEAARTLDQAWLEQPLARRVELLRDAARALGHAHARGIVHRDVKPQNILVDGEGRVRVADFGLATASGVERLTKSGTCVGTPLYMSPEQFSAGRAPVGPQADVWSLGVCLHEALTGTQPFQADHLVGLMQQIAAGAYTPAAGAPAALREVVRRALQVAPARRLPDGEAFAAALDAWLDPSSAPRRRGPLLAALAAVLAIAVALAAVVAVAVDRRAARPAPAPAAAGPRPDRVRPAWPAWFEALPAATRALLPEGVTPADDPGVYVHGRTGTALVLVPGGEYLLGPAIDLVELGATGAQSPGERPRPATIAPFFLGRCEVTVAEFAAFVAATGHRTAGERRCEVRLVSPRTGQWQFTSDGSSTWRARRGVDLDLRLPVTCVSFEDARAYCRWAGLRLATIDEWEAAARGPPVDGAARRFPWGDELPTPAEPRANLRDRSFYAATGLARAVLPIEEATDDGSPWLSLPGRYPAGAAPCGALDLVGNASEWVESPDEPDLTYAQGGSFINTIDTAHPQQRRERAPRDKQLSGETNGFRVALSSPAPLVGEVGR